MVPRLVPAPSGHLHLFDTAADGVVPVGPSVGEGRPATMYVCGITPYDATHMGHAFTYLTFDEVNRVWRDLGLDVSYVQNVTDVDDPLLERAAATVVDWRDLAESEVSQFATDMQALRIISPDSYVSVSESMPVIEEFLTGLADAGRIYQIEADHEDWYFSFDDSPDFGQESHLDPTSMLAIFAERGGDPDREGKRHPLDALVWRQSRPGEPRWRSRLGTGRPGWHVQCTAIAQHALGATIDVQGGGSDLIFPHHEMCAAQGRAATGAPFARAFVHSAMVGLDGEKMSKSKGNLVKVRDLTAAGVDPLAIRLVLLAHHYRSDWEWTDLLLAQAQHRLAAWRSAAQGVTSADATQAIEGMRAFLRQDLRTDRALTLVDSWAQACELATTDHPGARRQMADAVDALLGVTIA